MQSRASLRVVAFTVLVTGVADNARSQAPEPVFLEDGRLTASAGLNTYRMGFSVGLAGSTAVVGAVGAGPGRRGEAYVYVRQPSGWADATQNAVLTARNAQPDDHLGRSVAVAEDVVVAGATGVDVQWRVDSGAAYVFSKTAGSAWTSRTETARLEAHDGLPNDEFGESAAIEGDFIFVGASGAGAQDSGAVYVFQKTGSQWSSSFEVAKLTASDAGDGGKFGRRIAIDGGVLVVAAWGSNEDTGAVYIFEKPQSGWVTATETAKLTASNGQPGAFFGSAVDIDGDTIAVGAHQGGVQNRGAVYVFVKPSSGWASGSETAMLTSTRSSRFDQFGWAVAIDGGTVWSGAPERLGCIGFDEGVVYRFDRPPTGWVTTDEAAEFQTSDRGPRHDLGYSLAADGGAMIAGARNAAGVGAAYAFESPHPLAPPRVTLSSLMPATTSFCAVPRDIVVTGVGLDCAKNVLFVGGQVHPIVSGTPVSLRFRVGSSFPPGTYPVVVRAPAGSSNVLQLTIGPEVPPVLSSMTPAVVADCSLPRSVTLSGVGLNCVTSLTVGGVAAQVQSQTNASLTFMLSAAHPVGSFPVVASTPTAQSNALNLTIDAAQTPSLTSVAPAVLGNQTSESVTVTGTWLDCGSSILVGGLPVNVTASTLTSLSFQSPPELPIGSHSVVVSGANGTSNALTLSVSGSHPSLLTAPPVHARGVTATYTTFTDAGWNALYVLSAIGGPTALPGIVSFEIGGGLFGNLVSVITVPANGRGVADLSVTMPPQVSPPFTLHWQCLTYDPNVPLGLQTPLETSNAVSVLTLF